MRTDLGSSDVDLPELIIEAEHIKIKYIDKLSKSGIIKKNEANSGENSVHIVGKIDINIYRCITEDIVTDEVIITDERIQHIKERHPNDYERYCKFITDVVEKPDYILEANKPNSALVLKSFVENGKNYKVILRLKTAKDTDGYKNSIISFQKVEDRRYRRYTKSEKC